VIYLEREVDEIYVYVSLEQDVLVMVSLSGKFACCSLLELGHTFEHIRSP